MIKRPFFVLAFIVLCINNLHAQIPMHAWRDHNSYRNGRALCYGRDKVFCATDVGVFTLDPNSGQIEKLSKVNGLNDLNVNAISYVDEHEMLAVGYINGNLDLVYPQRIVNIAEILNKNMSGDKSIRNILYHNNLLYLSTGFGIVVVDPNKREIKDTYYIGEAGAKIAVYALTVFNGRFYAATDQGLLSAPTDGQFLYNYQNWKRETLPNFVGEPVAIKGLAKSPGALYILEVRTDGLFSIWNFDGQIFTEVIPSVSNIYAINFSNNKILVSADARFDIYSPEGALMHTVSEYGWSKHIQPQAAMFIDDVRLAIADRDVGLAYGSVENLNLAYPNGIWTNSAFAIASTPKHTIVASGGYDPSFVNVWMPFTVSLKTNNNWTQMIDYDKHDAVCIATNPQNPDEYFVGSWGHGVLRYNGAELIEQFTPQNSSLQQFSPDFVTCRISGMCFDTHQNLWVSNPLTSKPLSVRKPDGTWTAFEYQAEINTSRVSQLHCDDNNNLWLLMPRDAIFVLDPGNNIDSRDDDQCKLFRPFNDNGAFYSVEYNCMAFDQSGYLWLGTNQGVLVCYNPNRMLHENVPFLRVKLPDVVEGLAVYLLDNENVTALTVDGGNRKWFGTFSSGAFLYSADGTQQIYHFDAQNSPLPSNNILAIDVHPTTGEVFFGTDKGVVSFGGTSSKANASFSKVYAYPNPVKPDFTGDITIVGLMNNSVVKITDIAGNLVYETRSQGGTATWNGKNKHGHRAATGVYLVLLTNSDGTQKAVTKILFVN